MTLQSGDLAWSLIVSCERDCHRSQTSKAKNSLVVVLTNDSADAIDPHQARTSQEEREKHEGPVVLDLEQADPSKIRILSTLCFIFYLLLQVFCWRFYRVFICSNGGRPRSVQPLT